MGDLMDRFLSKGQGQTTQSGTSPTQELAKPNAPVQRVKLILEYFGKQASAGSNTTATIMRRLAIEAVEEMADVPEEVMEFYMKEAAAIVYYAATGERIINMPMPADFTDSIPAELKPRHFTEIEAPAE